ncbi:DUF262 domain-containing protein [Nocardia sp. NPDC058658]|uniref:DUF262 domain-containing protein n=1 Tax=Nocardia sp. NPDC058658 TaxID=3346580 RepID=UPI003651A7F8
MKADAWAPKALFDSAVQYEIPVFQRPYVWSEEDQWSPLWRDVQRLADKVIAAGESADTLATIGVHFLGAIVFKAKAPITGDVTRYEVIDGQQRTTTLQVMLDAAQKVLTELKFDDHGEALSELTCNRAKRFQGKPAQYKVWPSRSDRDAFAAVMSEDTDLAPFAEHRIIEASRFFQDEIRTWISGASDDADADADADVIAAQRAEALTDVLQSRLCLVAINLSGHDDDQLIFETLNDRGAPLLKADLIKNWIFQQGEKIGAETDNWPDRFWSDFDDDWWREETSQGRHMRSRIDTFLQYWLTMRTRDEVLTDDVFRKFTEYAADRMSASDRAEAFLAELLRDAEKFRLMAENPDGSEVGRFYFRVVQEFELAATMPLLMWIISDNHKVPEPQVRQALSALESWVIRRTLLRRTMKDVNKTMVSILGMLDENASEAIGTIVAGFLAVQRSEARRWPTDDEMVAEVPNLRMYGNIRQGRLRVVLEGVEHQLRTEYNEDVQIGHTLQIEHVMPRQWRTHWDIGLDESEAADRDRLINTLGNLTLVTQKLNGSLSHRPWTQEEAAVAAPTGKEAGRGKRSLLGKYSVLRMNKQLIDEHHEQWTDDDIRSRSVDLTKRICAVWAGPYAAP